MANDTPDVRDAREELNALKELRAIIDKRIERLQLRMVAPEVISGNGQRMVENRYIRPFIREWIDRGNTLIELANQCGMSDGTLRRIMRENEDLMSERSADKILTALGLPHVYNEIVPEPPPTQFWEE